MCFVFDLSIHINCVSASSRNQIMWCRDRTIFPSLSPHSPPILRSYEQFAAAMLPWLACRPSIRGLDVSVVRCDDFRELLNEPSNIIELILRKPPVHEEAQACQLLDGMMTAFPFLHNSDSRHRCGAEPCAADTQLLFLPPSLPLTVDRCRSSQSGLHVTPCPELESWRGEREEILETRLYTVCQWDFVTKSESWSCQVSFPEFN